MVFDGKVHVFYDDSTNGNIRWARQEVLPAGTGQWRFGVLDGNGHRQGRTRSRVNGSHAVVWNDVLSVVYGNVQYMSLRHAALRRGAELWDYEIVDGHGAPGTNGTAPQVGGMIGGASVSRSGPPGLPVVFTYLNFTNNSLQAAILDIA